MNLHQLRIFVTVARLGSFSRAAEELHISQPSASIQVADLERTVGVDLFEQVGRRIQLTAAGRVLDDYARRILALVEEAQTSLDETAGLRRGQVAVGATPTPGTYLLPGIIAQFQARSPQVAVTLQLAPTSQIADRLQRYDLDLGVVSGRVNVPDLIAGRFFDDELVLVAPPAHPLAAAGLAQATALSNHRLILHERGSDMRDAVEAALRDAGIAVAPVLELPSSEAIKEAVASGLGVGLLSRLAVRTEVATGRLAVVPMADLVIRRAFSIVQHKDRRRSAAVRAFVEMLHSAVRAAT